MRYIPTFCLREGMILGKSLYGLNNELMLRDGIKLTSTYISTIKKLQYNGLYVIDELSENIEIVNVIDETLRAEAVKGVKRIFMDTRSGDIKALSNQIEATKKIVDDILDNILNNKDAMINIIDLKMFDDYTYYHSTNVAILSLLIGITLNLNKKQLYELCLGALMHDIGKVFISTSIINKPAKLTSEEYNTIKTHPSLGVDYMNKLFSIPTSAINCILDHHEKFDGSGYPMQKIGDKISLYGRIVAVADVYDALISDRPYRKGLPPSEAIEFIMGGSGSQFDINIVKIFITRVAPYPLGTCLKLSNGCLAIVVENHQECCLRPTVKVFNDGKNKVTPYVIKLMEDSHYINVTILEIINM